MKNEILIALSFVSMFAKAQTINLTYDGNGNRITKQINSNLPVANIGGDTLKCAGEIAQLTATGGVTYQWVGGPAQASYSIPVDTTREFTVIVTKGPGCKDTASKKVTVLPLPIIVNIWGDSLVAVNQLATYSIPVSANATYVWTATNGNIINGQGTNTVTVKWLGVPTQGNLSVKVKIGSTCERDMNLKIVQIGTVGIEETSIGKISIYPNPSSDIVFVSIETNAPTSLQVYVRNYLGEQVYKENIGDTYSNYLLKLPRSSFGAAGVYTLSIISDKGQFTKSIIISE